MYLPRDFCRMEWVREGSLCRVSLGERPQCPQWEGVGRWWQVGLGS